MVSGRGWRSASPTSVSPSRRTSSEVPLRLGIGHARSVGSRNARGSMRSATTARGGSPVLYSGTTTAKREPSAGSTVRPKYIWEITGDRVATASRTAATSAGGVVPARGTSASSVVPSASSTCASS